MANRIRIRITGDDSDIRRALRGVRSGLQGLRGGFLRITQRMANDATQIRAAIIAIFAALPAALGTIAALIPVAVAGGFTALAAVALKENRRIISSFEAMKSAVVESLRDAAQPMIGTLVRAMAVVADEARQLGPALRGVFSKLTTVTEPLVRAFTLFAEKLIPGFNSALSGALPTIVGFQVAMGRLAEGISNMFTSMTSNKEALGQFWIGLADMIARTLEQIGRFTEFLVESGIAMNSLLLIFGTFQVSLAALEGVIKLLTLSFRLLFEIVTLGAGDSTNALLKFQFIIRGLIESLSRLLSLDFSGFWDLVTGKDKLEPYEEQLQSAMNMQNLFMFSLDGVKESASGVRGQVEMLNQSFINLIETSLGALNAEIALESTFARLAEQVKKGTVRLKLNNGALDLQDAKTRALASTMSTLISQAIRVAKEQAELRGKTLSASDAQRAASRAFNRATKAMGLSKDQARALRRALGLIPRKVRVRASTAGFGGAINRVLALRRAALSANSAVLRARSAGSSAGLAHGGVKGAQNGGVRSNMTLVGEAGPELVRLPPGSHVKSNPDTRRMLGGPAEAGGVSTLIFKSSGRRADDLLLELLRESIAQRGGDPVKVLGG